MNGGLRAGEVRCARLKITQHEEELAVIDTITASLNALTLISVLALVALGLAIIFGLMDVINLAHGELVTVGAYTVSVAQVSSGTHYVAAFWIGLCLAPAVGAAIGFAIEASIIRHLYQRPLDTLLATFGLSLVMQKGIEFSFGARPQIVHTPISGAWPVFGVDYPAYRLFIIAMAAALIGISAVIFARTRIGLDLRAMLQNKTMAEALGIDTKRVGRIAFCAGRALAATAGALVAPLASVEAHLGTFYIGKAFFVVIIGGIGSIIGTIAGSTLIGGLETALSYQIDPSAASALSLAVAIVLIRIRPQGLLPGFSAAHHVSGRR
jgi:urea ABC transporter permease protein UrtB